MRHAGGNRHVDLDLDRSRPGDWEKGGAQKSCEPSETGNAMKSGLQGVTSDGEIRSLSFLRKWCKI